MNAKEFVDSLFEGYEETAALADFKEELLGNLNAKIESFVKKGMDGEAAFAKASAELGDVSALADDLSLKKRKEVFEEVYMDIKHYMSPGRVAGYVVFGALALFGLTAAVITFFATNYASEYTPFLSEKLGATSFFNATTLDMTSFFSVLMPFLTTAVIGFTYLGITQETASMNHVSKKRGAWYASAAGLIAFGIFTMPIVYFGVKIAEDFSGAIFGNGLLWVSVISMVIPFILPGIGILVFLVLTEKDRLKPWARKHTENTAEQEMWKNPAMANRFGLFSGAIWIFAIGLFVLLGHLISFKYSWLIFIFATAFQLLIQGLMYKREQK